MIGLFSLLVAIIAIFFCSRYFVFLFQKPTESSGGHLPASGNDLDYYLEAIVENSLAVAEKCEHQKRKLRIAKACQEVMAKRNF
jgi:hypothetical protein